MHSQYFGNRSGRNVLKERRRGFISCKAHVYSWHAGHPQRCRQTFQILGPWDPDTSKRLGPFLQKCILSFRNKAYFNVFNMELACFASFQCKNYASWIPIGFLFMHTFTDFLIMWCVIAHREHHRAHEPNLYRVK